MPKSPRKKQKSRSTKSSPTLFTWNWAKQNTIYLSLLLLLLIGSLMASMLHRTQTIIARTTREFSSTKLPVLVSSASFPVISAQAVYAVDVESAVALYEKNPDETLFPASTTKMITALVAMATFKMNQLLEVKSSSIDGQKMGLFPGEKMSVESLLYGLLVHSANDASEVFAQNYPGGREAYVDAMNKKAQELHAYNTSFVNPSGLDAVGQYTTAKNLARIGIYAMEIPEFAKIVGTESITVQSADGKSRHYLTNRNDLLGRVEGVLGIKTGWTENARENLVTYTQRDGHAIVVALLGSQDRFGESSELIEWIFNSYSWETLENSYSAAGTGDGDASIAP